MIAAIDVGFYISPWKLLAVVVILLPWARLLTWIDKDSEAARLPRVAINCALVGGLAFAYALLPFMPTFAVAVSILLGMWFVETGVYLGLRHQKVGLGDLQETFTTWVKGIFSRKDKGEPVAVAGEVQLMDKSGKHLEIPTSEDPQRRAYEAVQTLLNEPLKKRADRIDLTAGETSVITYQVDGVRYDSAGMDRATASAAVEYVKMAGGMDTLEHRKPQTGTIKVALDGVRRELSVRTAGSSSSEALTILVDLKKRFDFKLDTLGLDEGQIQVIRDVNGDTSGLVIASAPAQNGLTSLLYALLRGHDAFLSHLITVERAPEIELEGVTQNVLAANATAAEEQKAVEWVASQEPDVMAVTSITDPRSAQEIAKFAATKRGYVGLRAPTSIEALLAWQKLVGDADLASRNLKMVISGRLIRKLCEACKIGYTPDPTQLKRMNIDPAKVSKLYQARTSPMRDAKGNPVPCTFCADMAYNGRVGVYEILLVDDDIRQALRGGASVNQLKTLFRKQKGRFIQEKALAMVEDGITSVQEVLRVMKSDGTDSGKSEPPPASAMPRPAPAKPAGGRTAPGPAKPAGGTAKG